MELVMYTEGIPDCYADDPWAYADFMAKVDKYLPPATPGNLTTALTGLEKRINLGDELPEADKLALLIHTVLNYADPIRDSTATLTENVFWDIIRLYKEVYPYDHAAQRYQPGAAGSAPTPRALAEAMLPGMGRPIRLEHTYKI